MLCLKRTDADCSAAIISDLNTGPNIDCFIGMCLKKKIVKKKQQQKTKTRETVKQPLTRVLEWVNHYRMFMVRAFLPAFQPRE